MSQRRLRVPSFAVWLCFIGAATPAAASTIGLTASIGAPAVVTGGTTQVAATVTNTGGSGGGDLGYTVSFDVPGGPYATSDTLAPGGSQTWQAPFDSTGLTYGFYTPSVTVTAPGATNSPQSIQLGVSVLAHAQAYLYTGAGPLLSLATDPDVSPLAFGATGGGETFAASALSIVNDPPYPTAGLDLDYISAVGDPQITTDLTTFTNLAADDNPANGHAFDVFVNLASPGTFTKTFYLYFSDQDLPGATAPQSVATSFTFVASVLPEPGSGVLLLLALPIVAGASRRGSRLG